MKKIYTYLSILFSLSIVNNIYSQCTVDLVANPLVVCVGDSSVVNASVTFPGAYSFDFNDASLPTGWTVGGGYTFGVTPCAAPSLDSSPFYWSSTSGFTPSIATTDLNVSGGGDLIFDFRFVGFGPGSPCETADQYNEGVSLEYSTDMGATWNMIVYLCSVPGGGPWAMIGGYPQTLAAFPASTTPNNGNGSTGIFDAWATYTFPIPPGAETASTRFRWSQPSSSGPCCDNWGLDNIIVSGVPSAYYDWGSGVGGFNDDTQTFTNIQSDTTIIITVTDTTSGQSCSDTVVIQTNNYATLVMSYSNPFCVGELVSFDATGSSAGITSYQYDLDHNGTFEVSTPGVVYNAVGSFTTAGNYTITIQAATPAGCNAQLDTVVQVFNNPTIGANVLDPTVCPYNVANFTGNAFVFNAPGQSSSVSSYSWDFNFDGVADTTGSGLTAVSHFFSTLGAHPVILTVNSNVGCSTKDTVLVTIVDIPHGNIVAPQVCGNFPANFSFNNTGTPPATTYSWNFGDTTTTGDVSSAPNPNYLYPDPGFYIVTLVAGTADGCLDTMSTLIGINPLPDGTVTNTAVCTGVDEIFDFNQTSNDSITAYSWTFPGGNPSSSVDSVETVNFGTPGPINVSLIVTNQYGCIDTILAPFLVRNLPNANFGVYPICISRFTFDPFTANPNADLDWTMGDGTQFLDQDSTLFNYIYEAPGDYNVNLVITDEFGCVNSKDSLIHVDDSLFIVMPNVLVQSSSIDNDKVDMEITYPGFNLCIDYTYTIFDRWGIKVFQTHNDPHNPDLYCNSCFKGVAQNGATLVPGVYYYVMEGNFKILKSGSITIFQ